MASSAGVGERGRCYDFERKRLRELDVHGLVIVVTEQCAQSFADLRFQSVVCLGGFMAFVQFITVRGPTSMTGGKCSCLPNQSTMVLTGSSEGASILGAGILNRTEASKVDCKRALRDAEKLQWLSGCESQCVERSWLRVIRLQDAKRSETSVSLQ